MKLPTLESLGKVRGASVLVRADLNVPLDGTTEGMTRIVDNFRIRATLQTLQYLASEGASITVCSHLGRPKGVDPLLSMGPVADVLHESLPEVRVLENLRFDPREEANDLGFAKELAEGHDFYVNGAFGVSHRAHASIVGLPSLLPSAGGRTLIHEVERLSVLLDNPTSPYVAVIGGAKISDKLGLLSSLLSRVDMILVGGGMCFTFLASLGHEIGGSLVQVEHYDACREMIKTGKIVLPIDVLGIPIEDSFGHAGGRSAVVRYHADLPAGVRGLDIGPATADLYAGHLSKARSILWNGPMGVFEDSRFREGTLRVAYAVAKADAYSIVGGGDSTAALNEAGLGDAVSHLSTGGGASLKFLETGDLVGLKALRESKKVAL
ncbi:MAG: phosphoglycerate kinase [Ferrimicrobium sp.]